MKSLKQLLLASMTSIGLTLWAPGAVAKADIETLMIEQCSSCHGNEVYTRPDRRVSNLMQLEKQLHRCNHVIAEKMDANTVTDLMDYLNKRYYKFKQ